MTINLINSKHNLQISAIVSTLASILILVTTILISPELLKVIHYGLIQSFSILILIAQIVFLIYIVLQKKYKEIGYVKINNEILKVKTKNSSQLFEITKMSNIILFIKNYDKLNKQNLFGKFQYQWGNFITFQYKHKTIVLELLLKKRHTIDDLIYYLEKKCVDQKIEIRND